MLFDKIKNNNLMKWFLSYLLISFVCIFILGLFCIKIVKMFRYEEDNQFIWELKTSMTLYDNNIVDGFYHIKNGAFIVTDGLGNLIYTSDSSYNHIFDSLSKPYYKEAIITEEVDETKYCLTNITTNNNTYLLIKKYKDIHLTTNYLKVLSILALLSSLIISIYLSYLYSRKNLGSLRKLLDTIDKDNDFSKKEFVSYKNFLLSNLIENNEFNESLMTLKNKFNINLDKPYYQIAIFHINESEKITEKDLQKLVIENVINEMFGNTYDVHLTTYKNNIVSIINFDSYDVNIEKLHINKILDKAIYFFQHRMKLKVTITLSTAINNINNLCKGYSEAEIASKYITVLGKNKVIPFEELSIENEKKGQCRRLLVECNKFKNELNNKNYTLAKSILISTFDILTLSIDVPFKIENEITVVSFMLYDAIVYQTNPCTKNLNILEDKFSNLSPKPELEEIKDCYIQILDVLQAAYEKKKNNHKEITNEILNYIHKNYMRHDLCVNKIAEHFDMSSSQISNIFKKDTGNTILKYIHSYRIKEAKKLLKNNHKVNEIANTLGYLNTMTFIRVFKKYENITPGRYMESLSNNY